MHRTILAAGATLALAAAPALAQGPPASHPSQAKSYGKYCQNQSKKKAPGQKKSAFATCVTAMAKAHDDDSVTAREACKALSKKKAEGQTKTPYAKCIVGVAQMRKAEQQPTATS